MRSPLSTNSNRTPIGLDIGLRTVKAVQLRRAGSAMETVASAEFTRTGDGVYPDESEIGRIESVLYRRGFVGGRVALGVPRDEAMFEEIERPPRGAGVPVDQIVASEVARVRRVDVNSIEQAWWELPGTARRGASGAAMAVATPRDPLVGVIERFEGAGLEVVRAEPVLTALGGAVAQAGFGADPFTVIVDAGWSGASLGVLHEGTLVYQRNSESCGLGEVAARAATMGRIDPELAVEIMRDASRGEDTANPWIRRALDELAGNVVSEIEVSLGYASHRFRADNGGTVAICGGGAGVRQILQRVKAMDGCRVRAITPGSLSLLEPGSGEDLSPAFAGACALACGADR